MPVHIKELSANSAAAGSDVFLRVVAKSKGRIKGEVTVPDHLDDIRVNTWQLAGHAENVGDTASKKRTRRVYTALHVYKSIDRASTALMSALKSQDPLKECVLTMRKAGGEPVDFLTITLGGGLVEAWQVECAADGQTSEHVSISFTKLAIEYVPQDAQGRPGAATNFEDDLQEQ